jgi:4-hydroxy-3-methylbut-2-en-1-yl diphosphate reductase
LNLLNIKVNRDKPLQVTIAIDPASGFCFGVEHAVEKARKELDLHHHLYSLGQMVHNPVEIERLKNEGLEVIDHQMMDNLSNARVLFRAHGEPPESYVGLKERNIKLIDATCPVVLKLQQRVKQAYLRSIENQGQVVIFGKKGHAEVVGLIGQTNSKAILVETNDDLCQVDFNRPIELFSQTTKDVDKFNELVELVKSKSNNTVKWHDTICRQVSNRGPLLKEFAARHEVMVFVGGRESSNANVLFNLCQQVNPNSYFIEQASEIDFQWFENRKSIGISGATSTPSWLIKEVEIQIKKTVKDNTVT